MRMVNFTDELKMYTSPTDEFMLLFFNAQINIVSNPTSRFSRNHVVNVAIFGQCFGSTT